MEAGRIIRRQIKVIEAVADLVETLRDHSKTEGRHMTEFGKDIISICKKHNIKQAFVAKLFDITPGAVSQHYNPKKPSASRVRLQKSSTSRVRL